MDVLNKQHPMCGMSKVWVQISLYIIVFFFSHSSLIPNDTKLYQKGIVRYKSRSIYSSNHNLGFPFNLIKSKVSINSSPLMVRIGICSSNS